MTFELKVRCSALGRIMTEPKAKGEVLSVGAKTYLRELAAQEILGVDFEISSREIEKGLLCETEAIAMLGRVTGLGIKKNTERKSNDYIVGECDLYHAPTRQGFDTKCSWSAKTFPVAEVDCVDAVYEWQCRGYAMLWDAVQWTTAYVLLDTPEHLIGCEPQSMHFVSHIPEHMRVTMWTIQRDAGKESQIIEKVKNARRYYHDVLDEFERTHRIGGCTTDIPVPMPRAASPVSLPTIF